jgi:hypothetical protein
MAKTPNRIADADEVTTDAVVDGEYLLRSGDAIVSGALTLTKSITIESPTTSEDITMFYAPVAITIQEIRAVTVGATTTINFDLYEHAFASRASAGTAVNGSSITADTDGVVDSSFTNAGIAADSWVVIQTTTGGSGSPTELSVSVEYTED